MRPPPRPARAGHLSEPYQQRRMSSDTPTSRTWPSCRSLWRRLGGCCLGGETRGRRVFATRCLSAHRARFLPYLLFLFTPVDLCRSAHRKTKLPVAAHVQVMGQIKIARNMGLMAHELRLEKQHLRRIREEELRMAQEQGKL
jgi:hypothetical protein